MPSVNSTIIDTFNKEQFIVLDSSEYAIKVQSLTSNDIGWLTKDLVEARFKTIPKSTGNAE